LDLHDKQKQRQIAQKECLLLFATIPDSKAIEVVSFDLAAWLSNGKQKFREHNHLAVERWRLRESAQQQQQEESQLEGVSSDGFTMASDSLMSLLQSSNDPDKLFADVQKSPEKAVLLHCLSSGSLRFDQCKDCGNEWDDKSINLDRTEQKIKGEQLSPVETGQLIKEWFEQHLHADEWLVSCGSCGIGMLEQQRTRDSVCKGVSKFSPN
jgi:hypothetical protein